MKLDPTQLGMVENLVRSPKPLAAKALTGKTGKAATTVIAPLISAGLIKNKTKTTFELTSAGMSAWEQQASSERKQSIEEDLLAEYLLLVEKKAGKKPTKTELAKHSERTRKLADERNYIDSQGKLSEAGELFLFGRLPRDSGRMLRVKEPQVCYRIRPSGFWKNASHRLDARPC